MAGKFAWKSQDARSCMQGTYKICSPFRCCVHHRSNRCPKVGCKKPGMLTLHAWEPDRRPTTWSQFCPTNFLTARTWLPGTRDLWYRGEAASYLSSLTPGCLITLDVLSLHSSSSVLWSQSRSTPNFGVRKTETSRQVELCYSVSSSLHLWFGWCGNLGQGLSLL